jgi:hypothetical protein
MTVIFTRSYSAYNAGDTATFTADTETALVTQGIAKVQGASAPANAPFEAVESPVVTAYAKAEVATASAALGVGVTYATPANTQRIRSAMARTDRNAIVACIGPSTTAGQSTGQGAAQGVSGWVYQLAAKLQAQGIQAGAENFFGDHACFGLAQNITNLKAGDARITSTATAAVSGIKTVGGNALQLTAIGDTLTFTPATPIRKWRIWSYNDRVGRNFTASSGTSGAVAINSAATAGPLSTIIDSGSSGLNALTLTQATGATSGSLPLGVDGYDDTNNRRQITFLNLGISGAQSPRFVDNTDLIGGNNVMLAALAPDLVVIDDMCINDWRQGTGIAGYQASLQTLITNSRANGADVVMTTPLWDSTTTGDTAIQDQYVAAGVVVAQAAGVPIIDVRAAWVSFAAANGLGWVSDTVHPTPLGYSVKANAIAEFIRKVRSI